MRKLIVLGGVGAAVAIGVTLWQGRDRASTGPSISAIPIETPVMAPSATRPSDTAPLRRSFEDTAADDEQVAAAPLTPEVDDGEHGQAQGELHALEEPPPSREAFGTDPDSEIAALAEARATLEALLSDPDPAVKERASALLDTIAASGR